MTVVEREAEEDMADRVSERRGGRGGGGQTGGFEFLACMGEEDREIDLDEKLKETRKGNWTEEGEVRKKGLLNTTGWENREAEC